MQRFPTRLFLTGILCSSFSAGPAPSASSGIQFFADAYGSAANVAATILAGRSALVTLGTCGTLRAPLNKANTVAAVDALPVAATGVVNTNASATDVARTQTASAKAIISSANLLSGLVIAREVDAVSVTTHDAGGFRTSASGSGFANLLVAGVPILVAPQPNTRLDLPGIGHVVLNEQIQELHANSASLTVNMIHVLVTLSNPLVQVGTSLIVGHATSQLIATNIAGTLDGFAYGTFAKAGRLVLSGRSAPVPLGCLGTNGALETESVARVFSPPELTTDVVVDTASGVANAISATGETTSTVNALNLLSSLVTADVVKADAHSFTDGRVFTFTDSGSSFVNLAVSGFPGLDDHVAPNTMVSLAGLGTLWLKREIFGSNSIEIRMIELVVDQQNVFGVPVGADIQVAVSHASAH